MRLIVADTSPLYYLVTINEIDLLPALFGTVLIPEAVHDELRHASTPQPVQLWATTPPAWLQVRSVTAIADSALQSLDESERAAITLALYVHADLILIDERRGARVAISKGFEVTGVLGVLELAARQGLIHLGDTFTRLKATNFRYRQSILDEILSRYRASETGEQTP